jgi:hypothetical protein
MTDTIIAEIVLAVIIVVGLIVNCLIGIANIKALKRLEEADKKAEAEEFKKQK